VQSSEEREVARLKRIEASFFSSYWRWEIDASEVSGQIIEFELAKRLPHLAVSSWPARFDLGGIYLAGELAKPGVSVTAPCRLEYYEPRMSLERVANFYPRFIPEFVIYSDDDLAVVFKPAGLPTTAARDQQRYNLQLYLEHHFAKRVHLPSRLDTGVSGLVICSFSRRMNRYLQKAYERHWIEKYYLAEVSGCPSWNRVECERPIDRDPLHPVLRRCVEQGGEVARTKLALHKALNREGTERALLLARPLTGRTHQIRLHCAYEGFPIVGDPYYGEISDRSLRLASYALKFFHPFKQENKLFLLPSELMPDWLLGLDLPVIG
jgi:23S rRNA pseudouridine1911/1915/1917 synthase